MTIRHLKTARSEAARAEDDAKVRAIVESRLLIRSGGTMPQDETGHSRIRNVHNYLIQLVIVACSAERVGNTT